MATVSDTVVATELVSKPQRLAAPKYRYVKVYPTRGTSPFTITTGGRPSLQFEIPSQSFNYSKSFICGELKLGSVAGHAHWAYKDCVAWCGGATLRTRSGATLFDVNYLSNYTKVVNRYETSLEEVMTSDEKDILFSNRSMNIAGADMKRPDNSVISHPLVEASYLYQPVVAPGVLGTALSFKFRIPLSKFVPNSVFSRKSDLKLPEIAILTLQMEAATKISFESVSLTDPSNTPRANSVNVVLDKFYMELAKQDDPIYETMIDERIRSGFVIPINVPIQSMTHIARSTKQAVSVTYNSGYGHRLVKIYHTVLESDEKSNTAYDNNCIENKKVNNYHVKLQGSRTTDEDLKVATQAWNHADYDDSAYLYHKYLLEDTSVTNAEIYHRNFVHIEDVARIGGPKRWKELGFRKDDAEIGIPLDQDYKFEFVADTEDVALNHYTFAVVQRLLKVNATGVFVE